MTSMLAAYVFEARSVQAYILAGGRLRDIVGGSVLVDWLTSLDEKTPLNSLQERCGIRSFPRAAGGAVTALFEGEDAKGKASVCRAVWRLVIAEAAPGLTYADAIGVGQNSQQALANARKGVRNSITIIAPSELPQAHPLMAQSQQMAAPAAFVKGRVMDDGNCKITRERADHASLTKRSHTIDRLGELLAGHDNQYVWPTEFDPEDCSEGSIVFPFGGAGEREIAIIHADGDGIGAKIMDAIEKAEDAGGEIRAISESLTKATRAAAVAAARGFLLRYAELDESMENGRQVVPARPVLLGGDDLTMIVRADLALGFLDKYCREFAEKTADGFGHLPEDHPFHGGITASGAAVFIKARQPFSKALKLTEELTKQAKKAGPGHMSFFRCTTSKIPASVEEAWPYDGLSHGPYDADKFSKLGQLAVLLKNDAIGRSGLRLVLGASSALFPAAFSRACKVMDRRSGVPPVSGKLTEALAELGAAMSGDPSAARAALRDAFLIGRLRVSDAD